MRPSTVGVVIPSYNQKKYFSECIEGVLNQTHLPSQIVVCDDASTDGSQEIIKEYAARHPGLIEAVLHPQNLGLSRNFNSGLDRIHQKYVSMVSADDLWHPDKIRLEVEALQNHFEARWAYSSATEIDEDGRYLRDHEYGVQWRSGDVLVDILCMALPVRNCLIETDLVTEIGHYDETFTVAEDWDWRIRLAVSSPAVYVHQPTVQYRRHPSSASHWSPSVYLRSHLDLYRKYRGLLKSLPADQRALVGTYQRERLRQYYRAAIVESVNQGHRLLGLKHLAGMVIDTRAYRELKLAGRILLPANLADRLTRSSVRDEAHRRLCEDALMRNAIGSEIDMASSKTPHVATEQNVLISAVICSYRRPDALAAAIRSLARQTLSKDSYEIVVIDNNSGDKTPDVVQGLVQEYGGDGLRIRYVVESQVGLSHARNRSTIMTQAEVIAFLDDDAVASPQWLESLLDEYHESEDVWSVGGRVDPIWDAERPGWLTKAMYGSLSLLDLGDKARPLVWPEKVIGVNCSFRRIVFEEAGLFATNLGRRGNELFGFEDTEIQQRIHELDKKVVYAPRALVHHHVPAERMTKTYLTKRAYFTGKSRAIRLSIQEGRAVTLRDASKVALPLALDFARMLMPLRISIRTPEIETGRRATVTLPGVGLRLPIAIARPLSGPNPYLRRSQKLVTDFGFVVQAGVLTLLSLMPWKKG